MKTATGLTLLAIGAILAFAVRASPPGLNINIVGWVIMLTGAAGFLLPRRASGWVRRRVLVRKGPAGPASGQPGDTRHPLDDASYPLDGPYPVDGASYLQNDASYPLDGPSYPENGALYPTDGASYPTDGALYPTDGALYPTDGASYPTDGALYPTDGASYPTDGASYPTDDASYPQYVLRDPAALAAAILREAELAGTPDDGPPTAGGLTAVPPNGGWADAEPIPFDELQGRTSRSSRWQ
jgi:hypothetical protein